MAEFASMERTFHVYIMAGRSGVLYTRVTSRLPKGHFFTLAGTLAA